MTQQTWTIDGETFRAATQDEIKTLQDQSGAPHVMFACKCGHTYWTAKNIALSDSGGYNGARNIFYSGWPKPECACPPSNLVCIVAE